ncbi:MAG: CPBP family intramembrane metalloprotease [Desulfobacterales bacterium]|nr:MAG: CPBP family intramembrane metalloprotease [Desulfobacterales bacterium]
MVRQLWEKYAWNHCLSVHAMRDMSGSAMSSRPLIIYATAAVSLTYLHYYGKAGFFVKTFGKYFEGSSYLNLYALLFWSASCLVGYVLIPCLIITLMPEESIRDYGLSFKGFFRHLWIYAILFAGVFPFIFFSSFTKRFLSVYPFYHFSWRSSVEFLIFETGYLLQFFALEFFFRGFLLFSVVRYVGAYAIPAMVVPYCMIHFTGKPFLETLAAIIAGLVLGTLSLRTRSIWPGVLIHCSVALSMDLLSMMHKGWFARW